MPLQKQSTAINFSQGLETKIDPFQISMGKFTALVNTVFGTGGRLTKRYGYPKLPALPDASATLLTTFEGDMTAVGNNFQAYSPSSSSWVNKGPIVPVQLSINPLIRNNTNQSSCDSVQAPNGLVCTVYADQVPGNLSVSQYLYVISDGVTSQVIIAPTVITQAD